MSHSPTAEGPRAQLPQGTGLVLRYVEREERSVSLCFSRWKTVPEDWWVFWFVFWGGLFLVVERVS